MHQGKVVKKTSLSTSVKNNRLTLTLLGRVTKKDLESVYTDVRFSVADLRPGFSAIFDLSACQLIFLNGLTVFRRILMYLVTNGVNEVAQVMVGNRLISKQIINFTLRMQGYRPIDASSLEEAESRLGNIVQRDGIRFHLHHVVAKVQQDEMVDDALIKDMSISGCALVSKTLRPSVEKPFLLQFVLLDKAGASREFRQQADLVRNADDLFAFRFLGVDDATKRDLWNCLVLESERELSDN